MSRALRRIALCAVLAHSITDAAFVRHRVGGNLRHELVNTSFKMNGIQGRVGQVTVCGVIIPINSSSNVKEACPPECPLWAEAAGDTHCSFQCTGNSIKACTALDPAAPIPDMELGICRSCMVYGCKECASDGSDRCAKCSPGFSRSRRDGTCMSKAVYLWIGVFSILGVLVLLVVAWIIDLAWRSVVNEVGLRQGLAFRSRSKLQMPQSYSRTITPNPEEIQRHNQCSARGEQTFLKEPAGPTARSRWPLNTNLCTAKVAGAGLMLHFNFQFVVIGWAAGIALAWTLLAAFVDIDFLILGTKSATTPRENCVVVAWGFVTQRRLMGAKVRFLLALYIISFVLAIAHSVRQLRIFQKYDDEETTHKDFCALCTGLPPIKGNERVEDELKKCMEAATGQTVVGVSVCWDFKDDEPTLMGIIENDLSERECLTPTVTDMETEVNEPDSGPIRQVLEMVENVFLSPVTQRILTKGRRKLRIYRRARAALSLSARSMTTNNLSLKKKKKVGRDNGSLEVNVSETLGNLQTAGQAYVVFHTESSRNAAVTCAQRTAGIQFRDAVLHLQAARYEPISVVWRNCTNETALSKICRFIGCVALLLAALAAWVCVFYLPYAYFAMSFSYSYGQEPGFIEGMAFSMIVVGGNAIMYIVCSEIADSMRFPTVDAREVCYMLLYCFACIFNVILDLAVTYLVVYRMMVAQNMHTAQAKPLAEIESNTELFSTYAMQKYVGYSLLTYAFPATFLIPFLLEPIITIYLPFKIMSCIIRTKPRLRGCQAQNFLGSTPMDLSRYGDILVNVMLAVLILFFPGGFTLPMFAGLALSNCWIYAMDHYRVVRSVPYCEFAGMAVDWCSQWLLAFPCGFILSCTIYKFYVQTDMGIQGMNMISLCTVAFLVHITVHTLILVGIVPLFGRREKPPSRRTYRQCSRRIACSWFSANPVHCLRSSFVYNHYPPCDFCVPGKEHLMRVNEEIGMHFADGAMPVEDFDKPPMDVPELVKDISGRFKEVMKRQSWVSQEATKGIEDNPLRGDGPTSSTDSIAAGSPSAMEAGSAAEAVRSER